MRVNSDPNSSYPWLNLLQNAFNHFIEPYPASQDVHTLIPTLDVGVGGPLSPPI